MEAVAVSKLKPKSSLQARVKHDYNESSTKLDIFLISGANTDGSLSSPYLVIQTLYEAKSVFPLFPEVNCEEEYADGNYN